MSTVLYRKYRPRRFGDVYSQKTIVDLLTFSFANDKYSHAYLFTGPRGTGKTTLARLVAKAANCIRFTELKEVCDECENCKAINNGSFPDLIEIDAASNRGIDEIRQLKESISFLPVSGKFKVYIIDEVHMLTKEAFNALLKTLEEPPQHVIFLLATTEAHKVPVTILSRVQRFDLKLAPPNELIAKLREIVSSEGGVKVEDEALELVFQYSGGSFRDAESILAKLLGSGEAKITAEVVRTVLGVPDDSLIGDLATALLGLDAPKIQEIVAQLKKSGSEVERVIVALMDKMREQSMDQLGEGKPIVESVKLLNLLVGLYSELKTLPKQEIILDLMVMRWLSSRNIEQSTPVSGTKPPSVPSAPTPNTLRPDPVPREPKTTKQEDNSSQTSAVSDRIEEELRVDNRWNALIKTARDQNFKLWTILRSFEVTIGDGGEFLLSTAYKSNVDKLTSSDLAEVLAQIWTKVFGADVKYQLLVSAGRAIPEVVRPSHDILEEVEMTVPSIRGSNVELVENIL